MKIPLVERSAFSRLTAYHLTGAAKDASLKIKLSKQSISGEDDAVRVDLSDKSKESNRDEKVLAGQKGFIGGALEALKGLTARISEINRQLTSNNIGSDRRDALLSELDSVTIEFDSITKSKGFKEALEFSKSVRGTIASGGGTAGLAGATGVLGDGYIALASRGATSSLDRVHSILSTLSNTTAAALFESPSLATSLEDEIKGALDTLDAKPAQSLASNIVLDTDSDKITLAPEIQEVQYGGSGDLSISLRGYSGADLLAAAASGVVSSSEASQLIITAPKRDTEKSEYRKALEKRLPKLSALESPVSDDPK